MSARPTPEQEVLDYIFSSFRDEQYPDEPIDEVFEIYTASQLLKHRNLSDEDISAGIVDGSHDGGIDCFYIFLNGALVQSDHPALDAQSEFVRRSPQHPSIDVVILQTKNSTSWAEVAWERLLSNLDRLLDNAISLEDLSHSFSPSILERIDQYRTIHRNLARRLPRRSFTVKYATRAPTMNITPSLVAKEAQVRELIRERLPGDASIDVSHVGAEKLYQLAGEPFSPPGTLAFRNLIRERNSFLGVASVEHYLAFVRDEHGDLRDDLFDSNVRDFEGDKGVNGSIRETLEEDGSEFWWQNNGITVLGTEVIDDQGVLTIDQPLIVNGLQTTHVLHATQRDGVMNDARIEQGVIVRVITTDDDETRDRVIGGTNRQTPVGSSALLASDNLQRDIERYLYKYGWFYERRKNQYKNKGKSARSRVSINQLAQAMMTLHLGLPETARARPTSLLTQEGGYERVFDPTVDRGAYLRAVELLSHVSDFLRTTAAKEIIDEYSNTRFFLLVGVAMKQLGIRTFTSLQFSRNYHSIASAPSHDILIDTLGRVKVLAEEYESSHPETKRDAVFKNSDFRRYFLEQVNA